MLTGGERITCPCPASLPDPTAGELDRVTCFGRWEVATPKPKSCLVLPLLLQRSSGRTDAGQPWSQPGPLTPSEACRASRAVAGSQWSCVTH